jgi:hypothetical protein
MKIISLLCSVVQRKLSTSPVSSPPIPGTTLIKKEKKKKMELEEPKEGEAVVRIHFFIKFNLKCFHTHKTIKAVGGGGGAANKFSVMLMCHFAV